MEIENDLRAILSHSVCNEDEQTFSNNMIIKAAVSKFSENDFNERVESLNTLFAKLKTSHNESTVTELNTLYGY